MVVALGRMRTMAVSYWTAGKSWDTKATTEATDITVVGNVMGLLGTTRGHDYLRKLK